MPLLPMALKIRARPNMKTPLPKLAPAVALQSYASKSLRLEARLLVHGLDDVLADAAFLLVMNDHERFFPGRLFLRGERDHLRLAGLLHALERIVILLLGDIVGVFGRVLHGAIERGADVGRQAIPEFFVDDH